MLNFGWSHGYPSHHILKRFWSFGRTLEINRRKILSVGLHTASSRHELSNHCMLISVSTVGTNTCIHPALFMLCPFLIFKKAWPTPEGLHEGSAHHSLLKCLSYHHFRVCKSPSLNPSPYSTLLEVFLHNAEVGICGGRNKLKAPSY